MSSDVVVYIGASSPLFTYGPSRNGPVGSSWLQNNGDGSECAGSATFFVELDGLYCKSSGSQIVGKSCRRTDGGAPPSSHGPRIRMGRVEPFCHTGRAGRGTSSRIGIIGRADVDLDIWQPHRSTRNHLLVMRHLRGLSPARSQAENPGRRLRVSDNAHQMSPY